ncbi:MAG: ATP-dependent DNA helicase [Nitrososphaeria archaeon]
MPRASSEPRGGGHASFPYEFRAGQREAYEALRRALRSRRPICFQAPTGFGKTPVVLAALLDSGARVLWAVRTGTETDRPIEELKRFNRRGSPFLGISFRGKRDMCILARERLGGDLDYEDVSYFCNRNRDACPYYSRLGAARPPDEPMLYSEVLDLGRREGICPYYYQRAILKSMDVVAVSYNYVLSEDVSWTLRGALRFGDLYLVVDEAHNLQYAIMNLRSDSVTSETLERAKGELRALGEFPELERALDALDAAARAALGRRRETRVRLGDLVAASGIGGVLGEVGRLGERVRMARLERGERPRSSLWHLYRFLSESMDLAEEEGVAFFLSRTRNGYELERWDMRASEVLREIWGRFRGVVFMSGTLEPLDAFADVAGVEGCEEVRSSFRIDPANVRSYLVRGISTRGERLGEEMRRRYREVLVKFLTELSDRNVAVFSSSYRIQDEILKSLPDEILSRAYVEREGMSGEESRRLLESFKSAARSDRKGILFASASGRFSEGADFPGEELEAAAIVGVPFERPTLKVRTYISYYQRLYGRERGRYLAYVVPALRRAAQALGRVIRSESDRGVFLLADGRYARREYMSLLPEFVRANLSVMGYEEFLSADLRR